MNIKFGLKKATIVLTAALLSVNMSAKAGAVYDYIKANNELMIATDANWAPFSYIDDDGVMQGFDVEVGREIAKRMGVEARFITPDWDVITSGNWNMRWDVSVGSMTPTASRSEVLNFPAVYYYTPQVSLYTLIHRYNISWTEWQKCLYHCSVNLGDVSSG